MERGVWSETGQLCKLVPLEVTYDPASVELYQGVGLGNRGKDYGCEQRVVVSHRPLGAARTEQDLRMHLASDILFSES